MPNFSDPSEYDDQPFMKNRTYYGLELISTCGACPEAYDVYSNKVYCGHLRLRHGEFTARYFKTPDEQYMYGQIVYHGYPKGDGIFMDDERDEFLEAGCAAILEQLMPPEKRDKIKAGLDSAMQQAMEKGIITKSQKFLDEEAVDNFAEKMKEKLSKKRKEGKFDWQTASEEHLNQLLSEHIKKGDPVDVANFAMMISENGFKVTESFYVPTSLSEQELRDRLSRALNKAQNSTDHYPV
jgi:hypothetical protein